jgi:metal-responsive CopG/Arc/MetJ family transcriptional regulator
MSLRPKQINVIMSDELIDRIEEIGKAYGLTTRAAVIRQAVSRWYYEMKPVVSRGTDSRRPVGRPARRVR